MSPRLSIVIPVFNEERTIRAIVSAVLAVPIEPKEIIIVDDKSTDGTWLQLRDLAELHPALKVIYQSRNQGKGAALRAGFAAAAGSVVVVQDADLEYDPRDIAALIGPIENSSADVVYGSRFLHASGKQGMLVQRWGNRWLTWLSNLFTGLHLTDMETGYKAIRKEVLQSLPLRQNRFGFEPEITARIARRKLRVVEIPITFQPRGYAEGKKIGLLDLINAVWCIIRYGVCD